MSGSALGKTYTDGQFIVRQGEIGDCMFAVQEGRLEVLKAGKAGDVRVGVLEQGDIFGEMAIFEHERRSATIRVLGEARVLTVDKKTFLRRVQEDPSLAFNLVRMMSKRIRSLSTEVASLGKVIARAEAEAHSHAHGAGSVERRTGADRRSGADRRKTDRRQAH